MALRSKKSESLPASSLIAMEIVETIGAGLDQFKGVVEGLESQEDR